MRFLSPVVTSFIATLLLVSCDAFAPIAAPSLVRPTTTTRSFGIDPSHFNDLTHQIGGHWQEAFGTFNLADAVEAVADASKEVATTDSNSGWFGFLTVPIRSILLIIHNVVASTGLGNAWGLSIALLTVMIKVVTFPLTKTQLESTNKMQAMQPAIKELQAKYQSNPEVMNQKIAEFYQVNEINPLAGCLPAIVQIPVFIGLYRAVLDLAKENYLDEAFLFLPSLEGPTYGADPASANSWLLQGWVDGVPSLGWDNTLAFLVLPIFLVVSQFVSMELMQPKTSDPAQQQSNLILKLLPFMIGWFALSVPSALSVYWVVNNIVTTATTLWIRNSMPVVPPKTPGGAATIEAPPQMFSPSREKPVGFGDGISRTSNNDGVRPITVMDAEIVQDDSMDTDEDSSQGMGESATATKKKRGKKKKRN